jgi:hypothetical protein
VDIVEVVDIAEVVDVDEVVDIASVSRRWLRELLSLGPLYGRDGWTRKQRLSLFSCVLSIIQKVSFYT